ncbi:DUF1049 domain-containing protein [Paenalkalicoccus suaedae]|uniref:DUF1049 domain-containing protein n=1 Tax=Paenalkalicoccus suaedae TaxID=2592382 RepID=A0A859FCY3_9BACI|nr:lipopolysaccharide assembly LapA domain-containing protein [Paenalkalicoccus suaedae]QKS70780.1 DUF1049 domain-containing protein [Paenalkalicoccus suaedae]
MKGQWGLITGLIIVLIIAIFAVINVDPVPVNYAFGTSEWPLVLVILGSVLLGGLIVGSVGMYRIYLLQSEIKRLKAEQVAASKPDDSKKRSKKSVDDQKNDPLAETKKPL